MKYFTIAELCASSAAAAKGIDNTPTAEDVANLTALVDNVLDPAREAYGLPIYVTSGKRSAELNKAVGGAANSQHLKGEAADITTKTKEGNKRLFELIKETLPFDQLINEKGYTWLHVSYKRNGANRKQTLAL